MWTSLLLIFFPTTIHSKGKQGLEPKEVGVVANITFIPENTREKENTKAAAVKSKRWEMSSDNSNNNCDLFKFAFQVTKNNTECFRLRMRIAWSCFGSCPFNSPGHRQQIYACSLSLSLKNKINQKTPKHLLRFQVKNELICFAETRAQPVIQ